MPQPNVLPFPTRMEVATVEQARAVIADLAHALRAVAPTHPVLDSLAPFITAAHAGEGVGDE